MTYFNDVKDNILVEAVQDTLGYTVVIPGSMDEQKILQVFELWERKAPVWSVWENSDIHLTPPISENETFYKCLVKTAVKSNAYFSGHILWLLFEIFLVFQLYHISLWRNDNTNGLQFVWPLWMAG